MMARTENRDLKEEQILSAASRLISLGGVEKFSMNEVARETGLSRPAIYQYFTSRDHILAELLINDMADLANQIDLQMSDCTDPKQCIEMWLELTLDFLASPEHKALTEISIHSLPDESRGILRALHGQFMTTLLAPLSQISDKDLIRTGQMIYALVVESVEELDQGADRDEVLNSLKHFVTSAIVH